VQWSTEGIQYSGIPFMMIGSRLYECRHGRDRKENVKEANKLKRLVEMVSFCYYYNMHQ